jgi:uncharacterized lipoprotein
MKIVSGAVLGLLACLLLAACTNVSPGSAPTVDFDKRYETQAAPTASLAPEEKTKVQNGVPLSQQPGSI